MSADINKVILVGRLVRDPDLKSTNTGTFFCKLSLAVNRTYYKKDGENKEEVGFFDCLAWGKQAEILSKYLTMGKRIAVDGFLRFSSWENKEGKKQSKVEIQIENFQFLDPANSQSDAPDNRSQVSSVPIGALSNPEDVFGQPPMKEEEIPF